MKSDNPKKKRINITIDAELHELAAACKKDQWNPCVLLFAVKTLLLFLALALGCAAEITPPRILAQPYYPYPRDAIKEEIQDDGTSIYIWRDAEVLIEFTLTSKGKVKKCKVIKSTARIYEAYAISALETWQFTPALDNGKPVDYRMTTTVGWKGMRKNMGK